jgi:hypothetical protein
MNGTFEKGSFDNDWFYRGVNGTTREKPSRRQRIQHGQKIGSAAATRRGNTRHEMKLVEKVI